MAGSSKFGDLVLRCLCGGECFERYGGWCSKGKDDVGAEIGYLLGKLLPVDGACNLLPNTEGKIALFEPEASRNKCFGTELLPAWTLEWDTLRSYICRWWDIAATAVAAVGELPVCVWGNLYT